MSYKYFGQTINGSASVLYGTPNFVFGYDDPTPPGPTWSTANINGQIWMAENLSYDDGGEGIHHEGVTANGVDLGEQYYYNSAAIIRISGNFPGWHLPTYNEVKSLSSYGTTGRNYKRLRSISGWTVAGTDDYGFTLYPCGNYNCVDVATGKMDGIGTQANIFCNGNGNPWARARFLIGVSNINNLTDVKAWGWWYNIRLIKDAE